MNIAPLKRFVVRAETPDLYDALSRLLADGQRFGIEILSIRAGADESGDSNIEMTVVAEAGSRSSLEQRLSRHPSIAELVIEEAAEEGMRRPHMSEA